MVSDNRSSMRKLTHSLEETGEESFRGHVLIALGALVVILWVLTSMTIHGYGAAVFGIFLLGFRLACWLAAPAIVLLIFMKRDSSSKWQSQMVLVGVVTFIFGFMAFVATFAIF